MINCASSFKKVGVVPVIKIKDANKAVPLAKALLAGGITAAEITFRTDAAVDAIESIAKSVPELYVCAGTVLSVSDAKKAKEAGAKAIISPGTDLEVLDWCETNEIPYIPGISSATELMACLKKGLSFVKLFPAETVGGISMIKALSGPFPTVEFMPTGGIQPQNFKEYLALKNVVACGGSWLVPEEDLEQNDFKHITLLAQETTNLLEK